LAVEVSFRGLNCQDCRDKPELRKFRGCDKPTEHVQYIVDGKPIYQCVAKHVLPEVKTYIQYYYYFKKGFLPFKGSIMEQPALLLQIFDILENKTLKKEKEKDFTKG